MPDFMLLASAGEAQTTLNAIKNLLQGGIVASGLFYAIMGGIEIFKSRMRAGGGGGDGSEVAKLILGVILIALGLSNIVPNIFNLISTSSAPSFIPIIR